MAENVVTKVLHTKTYDYNKPSLYTALKGQRKKTFNFSKEIEELKIIEKQFYDEIFSDRKTKDFNDFIRRIREIFNFSAAQGYNDAEAFKLFSSASHGDITLYQYLRNNLEFDVTNVSSDTKEKNQLQNNSLIGKNRITNRVEDIRKRDSAIQFHFSNKKIRDFNGKIKINIQTPSGNKSTSKKFEDLVLSDEIINNIVKEVLSNNTFILEDLYTQVIPDITTFLNEQLEIQEKEWIKTGFLNKGYKIKQLNESFVSEQIYPMFKQSFSQGLRKELGGKQKDIDFYYSFVVSRTSQITLLHGSDKAVLKNTFLHTFAQLNTSDRFNIAFNTAWNYTNENKKQLVFEGLKTNNSQAIAGTLGELSGMILFYYLSKMGVSPKWTGQDTIEKLSDEQSRADIRLETFGIQVKNFKTSTITKGAKVNLHPLQVMHQLTGVISQKSEEYAQLETAFANMAFNVDFAEAIEDKLEKYLRQYAGITANLRFLNQEDRYVKDTSGIWLIGGNMLIPGSAILEQLEIELNNIEGINPIDITYNVKNGDEYYAATDYKRTGANRSKRAGTNAPNYVKYWVQDKGNTWKPTEYGRQEWNNLINTTKVSIRTTINLNKIIGGIKNSKQFCFLNF